MKKRTKQQKIHAQEKRAQEIIQYSFKASDLGMTKTKAKAKAKDTTSFSRNSSTNKILIQSAPKTSYTHQLFAYDTHLIYRDLFRTIAITALMFVLLGGISFSLR